MKANHIPRSPSHARQDEGRASQISILTAYDASFARLIDSAGVDVILVGDSLGMGGAGGGNTLPVTWRR